MTTIKEDYVNFEIAKLLKEKGFDVYGDGSFNSGIEVFAEYSPSGTLNKCIASKPHQKACPAPTLQMAMKWLREVHHLYIQVMLDSWACGGHMGYYVVIQNTTSDFEIMLQDALDNVFYDLYEQACEAAIKYCLKNLI